VAGEGSLTIVGTGIELGSHMTRGAELEIEAADVVLTLVAEPAMHAYLASRTANVRSLHGLYELGEDRSAAYERMAAEILDEVRRGKRVCVALYGHPGVFVTPSHEAIRRARAEGFPARMLPGISAEDCLFADLGLDPSEAGCQSFEATDFLLRRRIFDPTSALVLWQIGTVGSTAAAAEAQPTGLAVLVETLLEHYPPDHEVVVYQASPYPGFGALADRMPLSKLGADRVTALATLYVPPLEPRPVDVTMLDRLGLPQD
jgi:uncharacterized protein YabN with tetrapyrrole methylase and pyrophosphatase domain